MKKQILLILLALLTTISTSAYSFYVDGIYYNELSSSTVEVTYKNQYQEDYSGSVVIPETVSYSGTNYSVTSIGNYAFSYCSDLTSVTIPSSVTSIEESAFSGCSGLKSITIPESVTQIGSGAFRNCKNLTAFYGKYASADNRCLIVGSTLNAFAPYGLTEYSISNSVTSIGEYAFTWCIDLTSITIPGSVTSIGDGAFTVCTGLTSITIPNSVTSIGDYAFFDCWSLTTITIPNSVTSIGDSAFSFCGLTSITIPESVTSIGVCAFIGCSGLTAFYGKYASDDNRCLIVEGSLNAFASYGLTEYTIPDSVTSIGDEAFGWCSGLTSITIPNSVTSIGQHAFSWCDGLTEITCLVEDPSEITIGDYVFTNVPTSTCTLYVPFGCKALYEDANQWREIGNTVELPSCALKVEDMVISPRKTTNVPVYLTNKEDVTSIQFDIHLPAGLTLAKDEDYAINMTSRFDSSFALMSSDIDNGIRVLISSSSNGSIQGNEGAIINLPVVLADQTATEGTEFQVLIDNIRVTVASDKSVKFPAAATATLTVGKRFTPGDVNDDGLFSAVDVSMVVSYVLGGDPVGGIRDAADVNGDGIISAVDVSLVVSYILEDRQIKAPRRINGKK